MSLPIDIIRNHLPSRKILIILGIIALAVLSIAVGVTIWMGSRPPEQAPDEQTFPTVEDLESLILFKPEVVTATGSDPKTATIYMDSLGNEVNNVRLAIRYDATLINNVSVEPATDKGAFFGAYTDTYIVEDDTSTGTLTLAVGSGTPISARGNLITLTFTPRIDNFATGSTTILLSEDSRVSGSIGRDLNTGYGSLTITAE